MRKGNVESLIKELEDLRIRESRIIALLKEETRKIEVTDEADIEVLFNPGDRIYILNRVRKPLNWDDSRRWNEANAHKATVTRTEFGRVYFTTDNGVKTWRLPENLERITPCWK